MQEGSRKMYLRDLRDLANEACGDIYFKTDLPHIKSCTPTFLSKSKLLRMFSSSSLSTHITLSVSTHPPVHPFSQRGRKGLSLTKFDSAFQALQGLFSAPPYPYPSPPLLSGSVLDILTSSTVTCLSPCEFF